MSARVRRYMSVLKRIRKMGDKAKRDYVRKCDKSFLDCISECAKNIIKGTVPLTNSQMSKLRRRRNDIRALSVKKTSLRKKRKILQKGGLLSALLPPVLSLLGGMFSAQ